jgi:hypothetical protein
MNVRRTLEFPWYGPHPNGTTHELLTKSSDIRESKGYRLRWSGQHDEFAQSENPLFHIFSQKRWTATSYIIRATATCCICCILRRCHSLALSADQLHWAAFTATGQVARTTRMWEGIQISWSNKNQICLYWSCPVLLLLHLAWNPFQDMQQGKGCVLHTHLSHSISETQRLWCVYIYMYIQYLVWHSLT